jgi:hypothetical protein
VKQAILTPMRGAFRDESPLRFAHITCQAVRVDVPALSP